MRPFLWLLIGSTQKSRAVDNGSARFGNENIDAEILQG